MPHPASQQPSFHEKLLDSMYDGVYFVDRERRITYWNLGAEKLTGYSRDEAVGRRCFENFLEHVNEKGCALCLDGCPLASTIADGQRREAEVYLRHKSGCRVPVCVRVAALRDREGAIVGAVEIFTDISEKKRIERRVGELENLAIRDPLTGLFNRRFMDLKVKQAIQETEQFGRNYGLLMIDVDRFKQLNDTAGHDAGDVVLRAISETLVHSLRSADIVGRWGGEEFLVLLAETTASRVADLAERCRMPVGESRVTIRDQRFGATVSIGATVIRRSDSVASAVRRADELMYRSKVGGRDRCTVG